MDIVIRPRQGGKTTEALILAARHGAHIVVPYWEDARRIADLARERQIDIPQPITWCDFIKGRFHGGGVKAFVIDDLDRCLQYAAGTVEVVGATMTDGQNADASSLTAPVVIGDRDRYGRQHVRVTVDGVPFTGWLEPAREVV
jgi:hypothetical protein